jgi:glycosyltransferase involved in cell wall biosynthesis
VSHGRDTSSGIKAYQITNTEKLVRRWNDVLYRDHFPNGEEVFVARDRSRDKPHILFIDHYVPERDKDAGSRTLFLYMKFFSSRGFQVTLWPDNLNYTGAYTEELQALGVEVIYGPAYHGRFREWYQERKKWIKYVFASRPHVAINYLPVIRETSEATVLYYGHDLHWRRCLAEYELKGDPKLLENLEIIKPMEDYSCQLSDVILYPSKEECDIVREAFPHARSVAEFPITIVPDGELDYEAFRIRTSGASSLRSLLFVGGFAHSPNVDAMQWFVRDVFPEILKEEPGCQLTIIGSNAPAEIRSLASPNVVVLGWVSDDELRRAYEASISIVPLRYGAGVKGKIIEAMALGVPVVSTTVGVQGIDNAEEVAFTGDDKVGFAAAVLTALRNPAITEKKSLAAIDFLRGKYSETAVAELMGQWMSELRRH